MSKHTPGPWRIRPSINGYVDVLAPDGEYVAEVWDHNPATSADAHLIAAAPDLLADAAFLLDRLADLDLSQDVDAFARDYAGHVEPAIARLRMSVAKAEGRG